MNQPELPDSSVIVQPGRTNNTLNITIADNNGDRQLSHICYVAHFPFLIGNKDKVMAYFLSVMPDRECSNIYSGEIAI